MKDLKKTIKDRALSNEDTYENAFWVAKKKYYREIIRKIDTETLKKILKIPDDWDSYEENQNNLYIKISDDEKKRLSDIKKAKSWEIRFESMHMYNLFTTEDTLMACFNHREVIPQQIDEALDAIEFMKEEVLVFKADFKHLMLRLAKRAASDLYYLMANYYKFKSGKSFSFEKNFEEFLDNSSSLLKEYKELQKSMHDLQKYQNIVRGYFLKSSNWQGWKIDEVKLKHVYEGKSEDVDFTLSELKKIVSTAYIYHKKMKKNYDFLKYYYNHLDGKLYRFNFICLALKTKLDNKKIEPELYSGFLKINDAFVKLKENFELRDLENFGFETMSYIDVLELIYKGCRIIEFFYLRMGRYEDLNNLRGEILRYIEKELQQINPEIYF